MQIILIYCFAGLICGAIIGTTKHITHSLKNNIIIQAILDTILTIVIWLIFSRLNHHFFYGGGRLYLAVFFALGIWIERKTFGKLFAKLFLILYNGVIKGFIWFKSTTLGKFITK